MVVKCFIYSIFLNIFLLEIYSAKTSSSSSGPYRSMVLAIEDCKNPTHPYIKDPPLIFQASINNSSGKILTVNGNFTVVRNTKNLKSKVRSFIWRNGKWDLSYLINNIDCHGMLANLMSAAAKVKYDRKNCMYFKGSYVFKSMDVNQIHHLWTSTMEYGNLMWRLEAFLTAGTVFCKEFDTVVEPAEI